MTFIEPTWLHALWAAPVVALLLVLASWRRRASLRRFLGEQADAAARASRAARLWSAARGLALVLAVVALALALARPGANPTPKKIQHAGRDVVVLLDVSRSMLAQDLHPSRLDRAKLLIRDLLEAARGDRIGVVAFAGSAMVRCPLTTDYGFARLSLESLTPDTVARGGTAIGDAVRLTLDTVFTEGDDRFRDIILITDGEDHESMPVEAAQLAGARGIRIIAVGLGSELEGAPVPADAAQAGAGTVPGRNAGPGGGSAGSGGGGGVMTYEGEEVRSKMDPRSLAKIAEASRDGVFLNVGTGTIQMDKVYRALVDRAEKRELDSQQRIRYTELFQIALGASLLCLTLEAFAGGAFRTGRGSVRLSTSLGGEPSADSKQGARRADA